MKSIIEIIKVEPFNLSLKFNNGEIRSVNLIEKLENWAKEDESLYNDLLVPNYFQKVKIDDNFGSLIWDNGVDLCPDFLYEISEEQKNADVEYNGR